MRFWLQKIPRGPEPGWPDGLQTQEKDEVVGFATGGGRVAPHFTRVHVPVLSGYLFFRAFDLVWYFFSIFSWLFTVLCYLPEPDLVVHCIPFSHCFLVVHCIPFSHCFLVVHCALLLAWAIMLKLCRSSPTWKQVLSRIIWQGKPPMDCTTLREGM